MRAISENRERVPSDPMKAKGAFHKLIQNKQDVTPSDPNQNHMVSQAFFTLEVGGKQYGDMLIVAPTQTTTNLLSCNCSRNFYHGRGRAT